MKRLFFKTIIALGFLVAFNAFATPFWKEKPFDWQNAQKKYNGAISIVQFKEFNPRPLSISAVRLELAKFTPIQSAKDVDWGKPMPDFPTYKIRTKRETALAFMNRLRSEQKKNIVFTSNTSPWIPWVKPYNHKYADFRGIVIANGEIITRGLPEETEKYPILYWDKSGKIGIATPTKNDDLSNYQEAMFGFGILLKDGKSFEDLPNNRGMLRTIHIQKKFPVIAYGIDKQKKYLYIVAIDGRMPEISEGVLGGETDDIMRYFGSHDAIMMDGGGSISLLIKDENSEKITRLNRHKGENKDRHIALSLGFILKE